MTSPEKQTSPTSDGEEELARIMDRLAQRIESGQNVDIEEYLREYPNHAEQLRQLAPSLEELVKLGHAGHPNAMAGQPHDLRDLRAVGTLGDFRVLREVGRGGMGVVYEAEQISLSRRVALKVLPFASVLDEKRLQRFKTEAQAAAMLKHPHIVSVYAVGCERGVHYYAMEFIEGQSLASVVQVRCNQLESERRDSDLASVLEHDDGFQVGADVMPCRAEEHGDCGKAETHPVAVLSTQSSGSRHEYFRCVARLGIQTAEALESAHRSGIVHRDIKPSNVLIDHAGDVYVADFGLAQVQSDQDLTKTGDLIGTLRYMSPEQASGQRAVLDHRTDIYSLGVTLYELVTGQPAFRGENRAQLLQQVLNNEPRRPRKIDPAIPKDLETVLLKAMPKDADDRYVSASELASDLRRFLENKPVTARRVGQGERIWRWARRNPVSAATYLLLLTLLCFLAVAGPLVAVQQATQLRREQRNLYVARINMAHDAIEISEFDRVLKLLDQCRPSAGESHDLRGFEWHYLSRQCQRYRDTPTTRFGLDIYGTTFSPDGTRVAFCTWDRAVVLCQSSDLEVIWRVRHRDGSPEAHSAAVRAVAFSPDGKWLASTSKDKTVKLWDVSYGRLLATLPLPLEGHSVAFAPNGLLAVGLSNAPLLHDFPSKAPTRIVVYRIQWGAADGDTGLSLHEQMQLDGLSGTVRSMVFSPASNVLVAGCDDNIVRRWDVGTGKPLSPLLGHNGPVLSVVYSPGGEYLATGGGIFQADWVTGEINLWEASSGTLVRNYLGHSSEVKALAFSPDVNRLASGGRDRTIRIWDTRSGGLEDVLRGHSAGVTGLDFSPNGRRLISGGHDNTVMLWNIENPLPTEMIDGHLSAVWNLVFTPDSRCVVTSGFDRHVKIWSVRTGALLRELPTEEYESQFLAVSHDGKRLATGGERVDSDPPRADITVWDLERGTILFRTRDIGSDCTAGAFSPDGDKLATCGAGGRVRLWNASTGRLVRTVDAHDTGVEHMVYALAYSANGRQMVSSSTNGEVKLWDTDDYRCIDEFEAEGGRRYFGVAISSDGSLVAAAGEPEDGITLWSVARRKKIAQLRGHSDSVIWVDFSPDGRRLASSGKDQKVILWDLETETELITFREHRGWVWNVRFSPGGKTLASCSSSGQVCLRRAAGLPETTQTESKD